MREDCVLWETEGTPSRTIGVWTQRVAHDPLFSAHLSCFNVSRGWDESVQGGLLRVEIPHFSAGFF